MIKSNDHEPRELEYDEVKTIITDLENDLKQLRQILKTVKEHNDGIVNVERHVRERLHVNMHSLNQVSPGEILFTPIKY